MEARKQIGEEQPVEAGEAWCQGKQRGRLHISLLRATAAESEHARHSGPAGQELKAPK